MKKLIISIATLALISQMAVAKDIKGRVTDAATGKPLAGVRVAAYGNSRHSAMTTKDGTYSLSLPDDVSSLYVEIEGMLSQQVKINSSNVVDVQLYNNTFRSNYSAKTTATRVSGTSDFDNNVEASIDPFIQQGLAADVRTLSRGAMEGVGNVMFINGLNSLNANAQPLVVVDGVILDMQYERSMLHEGYYNNMLANLNPNDIDKVEILKNGTAIYGPKAANGVVLVTTKRNKSMATKIDVTIGGKFTTVPRTPEMLGSEDFRTYTSELLSPMVNKLSNMTYLNTDKNYYYYPKYHNHTDWKKQVYEEAWAQKYGINVQGGDDIANYNLSVGYTNANTTLKENSMNRFDMRLNTDIDVIERLHVRFDASFSDLKRNLRNVGYVEDMKNSIITSTNVLGMIKAPFLAPLAYDAFGHISSYLEDADDYLTRDGLTSQTLTNNDRNLANPKAILDLGSGENRNTFGNRLVMFNLTPTYTFSRNLKLSSLFNFTLVNTNENYFDPIEGVVPATVDNNGIKKYGSYRLPGTTDLNSPLYVQNAIKTLAARQTSVFDDTHVDWTKQFGRHYLDFRGGVRLTTSTYTLNIQEAYNSGNDKTPNQNKGNAYKRTRGADSRYTDISWYALADYNLAQKYYIAAGVSAQASSRFGKDADAPKLFGVRWGIFPSIEGSWVMTNEKWLANVKGIDYLRLNVGYDITGNDNVDYTAARTYFNAESMLGHTIDGLTLANIGNTELKWETSKKFTAGVEANLFNNRMHVAFNYFLSNTDNLLTLSQMAWTSGVAQNWTNAGSLRNEGFDVNFSIKALNRKNWRMELGASVGHYDNKVTSLGTGKDYMLTNAYGATVITKVGSPVGMFYGYKTNGVYATTKEARAEGKYFKDASGENVYFQAGDMKFEDAHEDGVIDDKDRVVIGNPNPDFYGNIFAHLNYKRFSLDMIFTYSVGNDIYNYERRILEGGESFYNQTTAINNRWTSEGQITDVPRVSYLDPHGNSRFSDRWIEDGSYLRLSNVSLSYSLPINSTFLQGITIWGSAQNLFTLTRYLGVNPDCTASGTALLQGIDRGVLGLGRSFSMGVKINL